MRVSHGVPHVRYDAISIMVCQHETMTLLRAESEHDNGQVSHTQGGMRPVSDRSTILDTCHVGYTTKNISFDVAQQRHVQGGTYNLWSAENNRIHTRTAHETRGI